MNQDGTTRRTFLSTLCRFAAVGLTWSPSRTHAEDDEATKSITSSTTPSGVRYFEFRQGEGQQTPKWGDLVVFTFTMYALDPTTGDLLRVGDTSWAGDDGWICRHGNGQTLKGIEETLHTMKIGGRRRAVIPPQLAYVGPDLGPIPPRPGQRKELLRRLKEGNDIVVVDLELTKIIPTEDPFGYYSDPTPDLNELAEIFQRAEEEYRAVEKHRDGPAL